MKIKTKLGIGFGVQILLATILGIGVLFGIHAVKRQFSFVVVHDAPVVANARHLSKLVIDMETGQRGFCITLQEKFLKPYILGSRNFEVLINEEKKLVSDNPSQVALLKRIEQLVRQWKEMAAEPEIAMARKVALNVVDAEHLQDTLGRGVGKELMDKAMALGHEIEVAFSGRADWEGAFVVELIEKCITDREDGQRGFLITGKEEFLDKYAFGEQKKLPEYFARLRAIVSERGRSEELSKNVDRLEQLAREWTEKAAEPEIAARRVMDANPETHKDIAALLEAGTGKVLVDEIRREFDKFVEIETRLTAERYRTATGMTVWTRNFAAVLLIFTICVGLIVAGKISIAISGPIAKLVKGVDAVSNGNLDQSIDLDSKDEIGKLALSFNGMVHSLKKAERDIRRSETKFRTLYDSTDDAVMLLDENGFFDCNIATLRIFGCKDKAEFCDKHPIDLSPAKQQCGTDSTTLANQLIVTTKEKGSNLFEWTYKRLDTGKDFPAEVMLNAIALDNRTVFQAVVRDITKRKQTEQEIIDYMAVVESNNTILAELNKDVEAASSSKSEFLANMSHEIRTPMTAILGFSDILLGNLTEEEDVSAANTIKRNGEFLLELINDILDLSKIESGKLEVERITCSPSDVVDDVASLMRVRAEAKGIPLDIEYVGGIPETIQCDPTRLRQILINLVGNALKFTEAGSVRLVARLVLGTAKPPSMQFDVVDTGIGMTHEQASRLFKPFTQADASTTRKFGGTGLGLTISKRLAEALGGDITISSSSGKGSTFSVTVETGPVDGVAILDNATMAVAERRQKVEVPPAPAVKLDCRILLAEDGPDNQRLISFVLKKAGAEVTLAENGLIAHDKALAARETGEPFDIILMDMQMPIMDGYTATGKLRNANYTGPIVALTANAMAGDDEKCRQAGCDGYATKPIDRAKLFATIAQYLGQGDSAKEVLTSNDA